MFSKSLKIFFKNPVITLPNIIFLVIYTFFLNWFIKASNIDPQSLSNDLSSAMNVEKSATLAGIFLLSVLVVIFVSALIACWSNVMCKHAVDNEPINIIESLKESLKYYWRVLGIITLLIAIAIGIAIVLILACIPLAVSIKNSITPDTVIKFGMIILIFCLVMLFLSICIMPIQIVLDYDNMGIGSSISKGFKLGIKKFFPLLGTVLLIALINIILKLLLQSFMGKNNEISNYITSIISTYLSMFTIIYVMNLYKSLNKPEIESSEQSCQGSEASFLYDNPETVDKQEPENTDPNSSTNQDSDNNETNFRL